MLIIKNLNSEINKDHTIAQRSKELWFREISKFMNIFKGHNGKTCKQI